MSFRGKAINIGYFDNPLDAFAAYKNKKESLAKSLAKEHEGMLDKRVIEALNNFTVDIGD